MRDILYVMLEIYETLRACQKGGYLTQHLEEPAYKADVKEALQKEAVQRLTNLYWKFSTDVLKILMQLKSDVKPHAQVALPVPACWRHSSPPWPHGAECSRLLAALRTKGEQPSRSRPNGGGCACSTAERPGLGVTVSPRRYRGLPRCRGVRGLPRFRGLPRTTGERGGGAGGHSGRGAAAASGARAAKAAVFNGTLFDGELRCLPGLQRSCRGELTSGMGRVCFIAFGRTDGPHTEVKYAWPGTFDSSRRLPTRHSLDRLMRRVRAH